MLSKRLTIFLLVGVSLVGGLTLLQLTVNRSGPSGAGSGGGSQDGAREKFRVGFLPVT